jgi:hypothetical protein
MAKQIHSMVLAVRLLLFGAVLLIGVQTAQAKQQCSAALPADPQGHWSYRFIDGRKCWYQGENNLSKSLLEWPQQPSALSPFSETQARLDEEMPPVKQTISTSSEKPQNQSGPDPDSFEARWRGLETSRK